MNAIEVKDITKKYDNFRLNHVSLQIPEGTIILAFTFGPLLGYFTKKLQPRIHKWVYQTTN